MMLTPRQREIAELLARQMSYKAIGRQLGISPRTVEDHVQEAARRIGADGRPRETLMLWIVRLDERDAA